MYEFIFFDCRRTEALNRLAAAHEHAHGAFQMGFLHLPAAVLFDQIEREPVWIGFVPGFLQPAQWVVVKVFEARQAPILAYDHKIDRGAGAGRILVKIDHGSGKEDRKIPIAPERNKQNFLDAVGIMPAGGGGKGLAGQPHQVADLVLFGQIRRLGDQLADGGTVIRQAFAAHRPGNGENRNQTQYGHPACRNCGSHNMPFGLGLIGTTRGFITHLFSQPPAVS